MLPTLGQHESYRDPPLDSSALRHRAPSRPG
jgi:hypothetical protein